MTRFSRFCLALPISHKLTQLGLFALALPALQTASAAQSLSPQTPTRSELLPTFSLERRFFVQPSTLRRLPLPQAHTAANASTPGQDALLEIQQCGDVPNMRALEDALLQLDPFVPTKGNKLPSITNEQARPLWKALATLQDAVDTCTRHNHNMPNTRNFISLVRQGLVLALPKRWTVAPAFGFGDGVRSANFQMVYQSAADAPTDNGNFTVSFSNSTVTESIGTTNSFGLIYDTPTQFINQWPGVSYSPEISYARAFSGGLASSYSASVELDWNPTRPLRNWSSLWTFVGQAAYIRTTTVTSNDGAAFGLGLAYTFTSKSNWSAKAVYTFPNDGTTGDLNFSLQDRLTSTAGVGLSGDQHGNMLLTYTNAFR